MRTGYVQDSDHRASPTARLQLPSQSIGSEAARYWNGNRALIFLERGRDGHLRTYGLSLGKFDFVDDKQGRRLAVRWAGQHDVPAFNEEGLPHEERWRDAAAFIAFIRSEVARERHQPRPGSKDNLSPPGDIEAGAATDYFVEASPEDLEPQIELPIAADQTTYPPSAYTQGTFRWDDFDKGGSVSFRTSASQPGYDSAGAAQRAVAAWTNDPGSNIDYRIAGTTTVGFVEDKINAIVFDSSSDVPSGALAYAKWWADAQHTYKAETFYSISEGDVVVRSGISISQKVFEEAVAHELGHTLGFRHSDQGTPSSTAAVMKAVLSGQYGATLGPWDIDAAGTVYTGTTTTAPGVPGSLVATATSTTSVRITWSGATNATGYVLERSTNIASGYTRITLGNTTTYTDSGLSPNTTYVYRVQATGSGGGVSGYSNVDHATTIVFTDDPLLSGLTVVKAVHLAEIRTAVNAMRIAAGLSPATWTDPAQRGVIIKAIHITELRRALTPALSALGKGASFTDSISQGTIVKAIHFQEIRNLVK